MIIIFNELLHHNTDSEDVHEVISDNDIDHKEHACDIGIIRVLKDVHDTIPILQGRDLEEGQETIKQVVKVCITEE